MRIRKSQTQKLQTKIEEKDEVSEPEQESEEPKKINQSKLLQFMNEIFSKRLDRQQSSKSGRVCKLSEIHESAKKRKPLISIEEGVPKHHNKHAKDIQKRNLELAIESCLILSKKNLILTTSIDEEVSEKEEKSEQPAKRATAANALVRAQTAAFAYSQARVKRKFQRKASVDVSLKRTRVENELVESSEEDSRDESTKPTRSSKISTKVKKTGRRRGRPTVSESVKRREKVRFKAKRQDAIKRSFAEREKRSNRGRK